MSEGERDGTIRRARIDEAAMLTELTWRAVAYWGYDETFMAGAREAVRVQPEYLEQGKGFILEGAAGVAGFYILRNKPPEIDLHYLMVEPHLIGTGRGKWLWEHAAVTARECGAIVLTIASDPNAEPFYRAMGAVTVGLIGDPSPHKPGWQLRSMRFSL